MNEYASRQVTISALTHSRPFGPGRRLSSFLLGLLTALLFLSVFPGTAPADDASPEQVQDWIHRLQADPPEVRRTLIDTIRQQAAPNPGHPPKRSSTRTDLLPVLESALTNDDPHVRTEAICALCYMKCPDAFPILEKAFESRSQTVRYYAAMGVEWLADRDELRPRALAALEKARDREGEDFNVRLHAATALDKLGVKQEPQIFLDALRDPHANDSLAVGVLARMGRQDTVELMIVRLRTAVPSGDHWLAEALKQLTGQDLGTKAQPWQDWLNAHRAELPEQLK